MILVTHFACCHQYKGYWRSCPLGWSYFTVMLGLNLRAGGAHAPEFTRLLYFFEKHWEELLKFSRRTAYQMEQWAARYGYKDRPKEILDHAKKGYSRGRYSSINLQNKATIEFRIFRGTLKYNTLIATLQFIDQLCDLAIALTDQQMQDLSWTTFAAGCHRPELIQYLKERRLYVNDAISFEEDF